VPVLFFVRPQTLGLDVICGRMVDVSQRLLLEVVCASADDAKAALAGGADRIELCAAPALGGITSSLGTLAEVKAQVLLPIMAMIRPRPSGFEYRAGEFAAMERDVAEAVWRGADGVVFGILAADGSVDVDRCRRLLRLARNVETVFHRAFDLTPDPLCALDQLMDLGFTRILTSGAQPSANQGAGLIRSLIERAAGRIEILCGGGIRPSNVMDLIARTGCTQVHFGAFAARRDSSLVAHPEIRLSSAGSDDREYGITDAAVVSEMACLLREGPRPAKPQEP
jgi:copper homeostasis protein